MNLEVSMVNDPKAKGRESSIARPGLDVDDYYINRSSYLKRQ